MQVLDTGDTMGSTTTPAPVEPGAAASPPHGASAHQQRPSTASLMMQLQQQQQQRAKRSSSRFTDGAASRLSDDDAKTAVRVAVRVRPPLQPTDPGFDLIPQRFRGSTCEVTSPTSLSVQSPQGKKLFVFDQVFDENTTQEGVWDYLSDSVASFVKGYNVSILAYGQSGSGKSYTMGTSGPEDQSGAQVAGIVPRAAQALFEKLNGGPLRQSGIQTPKRYSTQGLPTFANGAARAAAAHKNWELKASYVEIYNETLRDLLVPDTVPESERAHVAIREDTKGRILLTGLTQVAVHSIEDLLGALNFGSSIRQTDATAINARSSRSHAVFSLNLVQKKSDAAAAAARPLSPTPRPDKRMSMPADVMSGDHVLTIDSKLHFVDLAGSERLKNTGATGDRAKEGIAINGGLAALGKVISQLSSRQHRSGHISYRDSRLTRLLQDSLGGNAITFMVACVTPAVFHLSETLNTVHYAQRARAIQSKPEIQSSREESDKQAAIDRLRAEVSFLRDQIRHSETSDRHPSVDGAAGRANRSRGRETELETQLMDMEDNYKALSQRHAKLIADLSKAQNGSTTVQTPLLKEAIGDDATARIQRSSSFAEAVEHMVLEYEKTIQSLESSLTKTRTSLSNSESVLLEKETRIAYMETIQQQLQARIQKAIDREQSNESYLRDLESEVEGSTSGEERSATVIAELKKELARLRESESGAEEYISTLEERLAEAEQDQEIMQREIERLEHVVERQRSIGRLDNLLGELDGVRPTEEEAAAPPSPPANHAVQRLRDLDAPKVNGHRESYDPFRPPSPAQVSVAGTNDDDFMDARSDAALPEEHPEPADHELRPSSLKTLRDPAGIAEQHSPAQNDFMADKVENLTQELFDLRSEHEAHLVEYGTLHQKYRTALETLAKLQYDEEQPKPAHTPAPADAEVRDGDKAETQASRDLPNGSGDDEDVQPNGVDSEGTGATDEPAAPEDGDEADSPLLNGHADDDDDDDDDDDATTEEVELLRKLHAEKEASVAELTSNYSSLVEKHEAALARVEELKQEVQKAQSSFRPQSQGMNMSLWRRKSEDMLGANKDRTSRSFVSLRNIATENFEANPDTRQSFELNLNTVMTELRTRTEKAHALEAELAAVRKELESKHAIISGLTRERSSLAASSGVDFSVVGQMRDQLEESENQIRLLHRQHAEKEKEFQDQVESLKASLAEHQSAAQHTQRLLTATDNDTAPMPGDFPETPAVDGTGSRELGAEPSAHEDRERAAEIVRLQSELATWESKHQNAMESMKASEAKLLHTIADLEESMRTAEHRGEAATSARSIDSDAAASALTIEEERATHQKVIDALQSEVEHYKSAADDHAAKLEQLEKSYASILEQVEDDSKSHDLKQKELKTHTDLVANLENQLRVHKDAIIVHQETLESVQANHNQEMEALRASLEAAQTESKQREADLEEHYSSIVQNLQAELKDAQEKVGEILRGASAALGYEADPSQLHVQIKGLVDEGKELHGRHLKTTNELKAVQEELQSALNKTVTLENEIGQLKTTNEETILSLEKVSEKEKKSARLVEELEEQLNTNFDSQQQATHRLSTMQNETVQVRMELERELEEQRMRNNMLEQQIATLKHQSVASNSSGINFNRESLSPETATTVPARSSSQASTRKSGPQPVLPTPPPSIPLPPLPGTSAPNGAERATSPTQRAGSPVTNGSPPGSRHASDVGQNTSQLVEEQEARIRTIEKHLFAEKQLTATLEEALVDLETSANRTKSEMETWRKKCTTLEDELVGMRKDRTNSRASLQAVEEEREMRLRAEKARQALEQRMMELNSSKKKKKNSLNCF